MLRKRLRCLLGSDGRAGAPLEVVPPPSTYAPIPPTPQHYPSFLPNNRTRPNLPNSADELSNIVLPDARIAKQFASALRRLRPARAIGWNPSSCCTTAYGTRRALQVPLLAALLDSRGGGQARSPRDAGRRTLLATNAPARGGRLLESRVLRALVAQPRHTQVRGARANS